MAVNSVQTGLRLPLTGLAPPRLLMCSASMGAEGSVTLQLREAVQAPISDSTTINNALTIGYPDPEILADVLGTFQAAGSDATYDIVTNGRQHQSAQFFKTANNITTIKQETVAKVIEASNIIQKTSTSTPTTSVASIVVSTQHQPITMTTLASTATISNSSNSNLPQANSLSTVTSTQPAKKSRPKTASPTRHGPQQCQVCSKVFGNASALAKHKLTHSDERKYVCGMCSKAFKRQDHLNGHMLTHRNKKPYECKAEGCGKSYCDARSLRRHTENHHSSLVLATTTTTTSSSQNQSNSVSSNNASSGTSTITNPSLSPATASGDASSPHGATCIQYQMNADGNTITAINSKSPSPSSPAGTNNEGLTRQQLDLISQIMQQTKHANGHKSSAQRPRTWNMQQNQVKTSTTTIEAAVKSNANQQQVSTSTSTTTNSNQTTQAQKNTGANGGDQKPVECNLCHRKFKNIPALNGHMRLHGGYFKKDTDTKKSDKKESSGPPLQTASVGVRALIEEKIINKRSKDLKGAFVVPAAPLSTTRRLAEAEAFLNAKNVSTLSNTNNNTITIVASGLTSNTFNGLTKQAIVQQVAQQTATNVVQKATQISTLSSEKDATLIELLKRGTTKVAVKRASTDSNTSNTIQATRVVVPASISTTETVSDSSPASLVLSSNGSSSPLSLTISQAPSTSGSSGDIYALTYSANSSPSFLSDSDVYSVNDTAMLLQAVDSIHLLQDNSTSDHLDDIASLSDYTSLSDSVSLNQSFTPSRQLQAVLDSPLPDSLVEFGTLNSKDYVLYGCSSSNESPTSSSPLPSPLAYPTPPASHEAIAQASPFLDDSHHFSDVSTFFHDDKKTNMKNNNNSVNDFGLLDDSNELFHNMKDTKDNSNLTESERILQLKNELFNDSKAVLEEFRNCNSNSCSGSNSNKSILDNSFLNNDSKTFIGDNSAKLQDFNQNLDFLDEAQAFNIVDDDRVNASSPLSAAFFSSMSTAEEVKEALEEVLPNEDDGAGSTLDLYFLSAGLSLQSQMMSNSDDPLLSSVPRDFGHHRSQPHLISSSTSSSLQNSQSHETPNFDIDPFSPPENKKIKIESHHNSPIIESSDNSDKNLLSVQTEQILTKDNIGSVFLSPNSISSSSSGSSPKILQSALLSNKRKFNSFNDNNLSCNLNEQYEMVVKKHEQFKSKMKRISQLHYTPSPILNPERYGIGLYASVPIDRLNNDFDDEVDMIDFFEKPRVNIGTDYQATLPSEIIYNNNSFNNSVKSEDKKTYETLLWKPNVLEDDRQLDRYIDLTKSSAVPTHSIESALKILMESQGEVHVAVLKLLQSSDKSLDKLWSQTEMEQFLKGLEIYGKDFTSIARGILNKTTGDCVQLYYFWKKLCNEYKSTHLPQQQNQQIQQQYLQLCHQHHHHQQQSSRDCNMIGNDNKHNNNSDDFFDYVENINDNNNLSNSTIQNGNGHNNNNNINSTVAGHNNELRPHVCEVPDCSASFSSRVALHGHTRIHCIGRSMNQLNNGNLLNNSNQAGTSIKDEFSFPCKVCGKVFNKVKSRSAHMKSHRPQENEIQQC
ncbi:uncharacterized protein [Chironomus tepperi]|uniref:uncharacterized protein isoform X2 n=1 Tax=Chironomus tepperi TaxID=113505 RepID=UPI00391F8762